MVPLDHLLLETDSPYLPPQVIRGKRNDPTYVKEVYKKAVEVMTCPWMSFAKLYAETSLTFLVFP